MKEELLAPFKEVFEEQQGYYEARAKEYDQWWNKTGKYDLGRERNEEIFQAIEVLRAEFDGLSFEGEVLELAGGTGIWTEYLASRARRVTVVDGSEAMIFENRARLASKGLDAEFHRADLLRWVPQKTYDAVFMAFWVSHLPSELLAPFFSAMASGLKPGGLMVVLEGAGPGTLRSPAMQAKQGTFKSVEETELRTLNDGRKFRIFKRDDTPESLSGALAAAGLRSVTKLVGRECFLMAAAYKP